MASTDAKSRPEKIANYRSTQSFSAEQAERKWLLVDAKGRTLGRLATTIANVLRGKHKPTFTPHADLGDYVVVINAEQVELVGNDKRNKKIYHKHTGYRGNLKRRSAATMFERAPEMVLFLAVKRMVPRGALGNHVMKKLKVYTGAEHPHKAQQPQLLALPPARE